MRKNEKERYKVFPIRLNKITVERLKKKELNREKVGICSSLTY